MPRIEEALHVVGMSNPGGTNGRTCELSAGLGLIVCGGVLYECAAHCAAIQPRPIALVVEVVVAAALAVNVLELSAGTLPVEILEIRQDRRLVKRVGGVDLGVGVGTGRSTLLGRDDDDTVRRT